MNLKIIGDDRHQQINIILTGKIVLKLMTTVITFTMNLLKAYLLAISLNKLQKSDDGRHQNLLLSK